MLAKTLSTQPVFSMADVESVFRAAMETYLPHYTVEVDRIGDPHISAEGIFYALTSSISLHMNAATEEMLDNIFADDE